MTKKEADVQAKVVIFQCQSAISVPLTNSGKTSTSVLESPKDVSAKALPVSSAPIVVASMERSTCSPPAASNQYVPMLPSFVSAVLVVVGWFVVNKAQANRERRKQIREHVAALRSELDDLEILVINYHSNTRDVPTEREIVSKLGRLEKACSSLPRFLNDQRVFPAMRKSGLTVNSAHIQQLRKAMTLKHFADEHERALDAQDEQIKDIEYEAEVVQEDLECVRIAALD